MAPTSTRVRVSIFASLLVATLLAAPALGAAAEWPEKPVTFVVPFPPGGSVDPLARLLGEKLSASLGQNFIVENRPGAAGSIGAAVAARAPADGYTFLFVFDTHAVNPALLPDLPFDTEKDLEPVMLVGTSPMVIVTLQSKPFQSFADVIRAAKSDPGAVTYGTIGAGSLGNLTMTLVQQEGAFELTHVPYKGGAPMTQDALGGHVDLAIGSVALLGEQIKSGRLRPLGVTGERRAKLLPDVPTLKEQGVAEFSALSWWAILAPSGTPAPITQRLHSELEKALAQPDVQNTLSEQLGMELVISSPQEFGAFLASEMKRWAAVVRDNHIQAN